MYLIMRSTHAAPRCYGTRLFVGESYDDEDYGYLVWTDDDQAVWDQACRLVKAGFGDLALRRLIPDEKTTDITIPNRQCIYVLEASSWSDKHPYFGEDISIQYRIPGTHPEEDVWEAADAREFVKVADAEDDTLWILADLEGEDFYEGYLIIPRDMATKHLRKAAIVPCHEEVSTVKPDICCL